MILNSTIILGLVYVESFSWKLSPGSQQSSVLPLSLPWTWNTNGIRNLKHLPPGFPLPPPPSLPPSQEPDESTSIIHSLQVPGDVKEGDWVLIKTIKKEMWSDPKWEGPFQVLLTTPPAVKIQEGATSTKYTVRAQVDS
ncbi:hypothetical protein AMECASPLE_002790 [Ameca splendens]|uniref:Murine leukemia virus integrase C-terminal domain-containing protein n=1 Tax=Ameca splendens TaxID=208324 RepID=A0ABV1A5J2_9TELE